MRSVLHTQASFSSKHVRLTNPDEECSAHASFLLIQQLRKWLQPVERPGLVHGSHEATSYPFVV